MVGWLISFLNVFSFHCLKFTQRCDDLTDLVCLGDATLVFLKVDARITWTRSLEYMVRTVDTVLTKMCFAKSQQSTKMWQLRLKLFDGF